MPHGRDAPIIVDQTPGFTEVSADGSGDVFAFRIVLESLAERTEPGSKWRRDSGEGRRLCLALERLI
jgi:hypothetical protein